MKDIVNYSAFSLILFMVKNCVINYKPHLPPPPSSINDVILLFHELCFDHSVYMTHAIPPLKK